VAPAHWAGEVTARGVAHKSHENCGRALVVHTSRDPLRASRGHRWCSSVAPCLRGDPFPP